MPVQKIQHHSGHHFYARDQTFFINIKFRGVPFGRDAFGFAAGAKAQEKAGNHLLVKAKILGAHALGDLEDIGLADGPTN